MLPLIKETKPFLGQNLFGRPRESSRDLIYLTRQAGGALDKEKHPFIGKVLEAAWQAGERGKREGGRPLHFGGAVHGAPKRYILLHSAWLHIAHKQLPVLGAIGGLFNWGAQFETGSHDVLTSDYRM